MEMQPILFPLHQITCESLMEKMVIIVELKDKTERSISKFPVKD